MTRSNIKNTAALVNDIKQLAGVLDDALGLLNTRREKKDFILNDIQGVKPSLIDQCIAMCKQVETDSSEPVRTIHHLSCTGGTLITKCLAAMPNVMVLNEVDPLSTLDVKVDNPEFKPTDMIALLRQGGGGVEDDLILDLFRLNLDRILGEMRLAGRRLLLRDHSHSHFLTQVDISSRPSLLEVISEQYETKSIVTVRDPIDSYLSLQNMGWIMFEPGGFNEYCRRYHLFLDAYKGVEIFRYEEFVENPKCEAEKMCHALEMSYTDNFVDTFDIFKLSGDSGRSGGEIGRRPRRECAEGFWHEVKQAEYYSTLAGRLGYA